MGSKEKEKMKGMKVWGGREKNVGFEEKAEKSKRRF